MTSAVERSDVIVGIAILLSIGCLVTLVGCSKPTERPERLLTLEIAEQWMEDKDSVDLYRFTSIEDAAAKALGKHGGGLRLIGLRSLSDSAAEALAKHEGMLDLSGVKTLSDAAADALGKHDGGLGLLGLTALSDGPGHAALVEKMAEQEEILVFKYVTEISDVAAEVLARHDGTLFLIGLTELSDDQAEVLSKHEDALYVDYDKLPPSAAKILRDSRNPDGTRRKQ